MTRKYYHGTTRANAENILKGGAKTGATWIVSDDDYLYLWDAKKVAEAEFGSEYEDGNPEAIRYAFESAQITAAASREPQSELVVLEFSIPRKHIEPDESCENMADSGAVRVRLDDYKKYHTGTFACPHNSRLDVFILASLTEREYFNGADVPEELLDAAKKVADVYLDELYEFDWHKE